MSDSSLRSPWAGAITQQAIEMIYAAEITSREHYERSLKHPTLPGGASGITIGIGYDIGQTDLETFRQDWKGKIPNTDWEALSHCVGKNHAESKALLVKMKPIEIPYDKAVEVFLKRDIRRYMLEAKKDYPGIESLPAECYGAIVSMVQNRGGVQEYGDHGIEERGIREALDTGRYDLIPKLIRKSERLWEGKKDMEGLINRREKEADLFEKGLKKYDSIIQNQSRGMKFKR